MKDFLEHRGIQYSVTDEGNGEWGWKLHPNLDEGKSIGRHIARGVICGKTCGTRGDAISAAETAIETELAKPNPFNLENVNLAR